MAVAALLAFSATARDPGMAGGQGGAAGARAHAGDPGSRDASSLAREVLRLERDRRSVRGALCCATPGVAIAREHLAIRDAFRSDDALKRIEPMPVIGFASIGIAGGLGALDLLREHCCPLRPRE